MTSGMGVEPFDRIRRSSFIATSKAPVRPPTVMELARKAGRPLPVEDPTELYVYDSLNSFLADLLARPGVAR